MASSSRTGNRGKKSGGRRRHAQRPPGADYYVQHTDRDMVFLIPSEMEETVTVVKRVRRVEEKPTTPVIDCGWGTLIPHEIIHRVFQLVVANEGAVPTLCRLAQVCRLWRQVASSPDLWQRVSVSRCWVVPTKKDSPHVQNKVKKTMENLLQHRLSQVCDFSLHHWGSLVPLVLQGLASSCPLLSSLTLSHCSKVTVDALESVGDRCRHLTSLSLQNSQVDLNAVSRFLAIRGDTLQRLYLSFSCQTYNILSLLASGSCPELRLLEVTRGMNEPVRQVNVSMEGLQASCPKLEVLRMLNVILSLKSKTSSTPETPCFSRLQELSLATSSYSLITDTICQKLLRDCPGLRVLDLRGCYRMTPQGISDLPCTDVERLYLGIYCSDAMLEGLMPATGCSLLTRRWRHSLQELDLTGQNFLESDLSEALSILCGAGTNDTLLSLSLTGTKVPPAAVRDLLSSCRALTHLDLTSCRNIPRGLKCVYRGLEDMRRCLETMTRKMEEQESAE